MVDREEELRSQLDTYAEKFDQVQDAINKSNQVFNTFKREMEQVIFLSFSFYISCFFDLFLFYYFEQY